MKAKLKQQLLLSGLIAFACSNSSVVMATSVSAKEPLDANTQLSSSQSFKTQSSFFNSPLMTLRPGGGPRDGGDGHPQGGGGNGGGGHPQGQIDAQLRALITAQNLDVSPTAGRDLPTAEDIMVQLGKSLFFANNLGGTQSVSCASCHHPNLGGADQLSLPVGVNAVNVNDIVSPALLGHGRFQGNSDGNRPVIGRNSPTVFNMGLFDRGLFWDSRVEAIEPRPGANGTASAIITPDSDVDEQGRRLPDSYLPIGTSLPAAQARFPVTSVEEMRGEFASDADNQGLRALLTGRFDNSDVAYESSWPVLFAQAYPDGEINFDRIAHAIGEYERSMNFVNNPWQAYLAGDDTALTAKQKKGAILFFAPVQEGGAGCSGCHNGPTFSDSRHHLTAFPQIGPGTGDTGVAGATDDFGREKVTGNEADRYHFRTPSLLNVAVTAPYGHSGAYQTLEQVVRHYRNPRGEVNRLFAAVDGQPFTNGHAPLCQSKQIAAISEKNNLNCEQIYPDAYANSRAALNRLRMVREGQVEASSPFLVNAPLNNRKVKALVAFLHALTDPCVTDSECMQPWVIDADDVATFPDDNPLVGYDAAGDAL